MLTIRNIAVAITLSAIATPAAFAETSLKLNEPFQAHGVISNYYGKNRSAEGLMWANASKVCQEISGEGSGVLLNRLSEVSFRTDNAATTAEAMFICVPGGLGE